MKNKFILPEQEFKRDQWSTVNMVFPWSKVSHPAIMWKPDEDMIFIHRSMTLCGIKSIRDCDLLSRMFNKDYNGNEISRFTMIPGSYIGESKYPWKDFFIDVSFLRHLASNMNNKRLSFFCGEIEERIHSYQRYDSITPENIIPTVSSYLNTGMPFPKDDSVPQAISAHRDPRTSDHGIIGQQWCSFSSGKIWVLEWIRDGVYNWVWRNPRFLNQ